MRARAATRCGVVALAALAVAGCGGGEDGGGSAEATATAASGTPERRVEATMKDFEFEPSELSVAAGGTIRWTDEDSSNHNVVFKTEGAPKGIANLREGESGEITFPDPGTYDFVCSYHPNMRGSVDVR